MKILKFCLLPFAFFTTVSLYGNPKELVCGWYAAREIEWHMWQHDGPKHIERIFEKLNRGEKVTTEDVKPLFPKECHIKGVKLKAENTKSSFVLTDTSPSGHAFDKNWFLGRKLDCISIELRCRDIPFVLCLKNGTIFVHVIYPNAQGYIYLTADKKVPNVEELMRYACEYYDVFSKHLYMLLNEHISTKREANPFAVKMRNAFDEQNGYTFNQVVDPVPCFVVNAENTYAFIQRWVRQQYEKGRSVSAITADLQPVYKRLLKGVDGLCNRVGEFFQSTVIDTVENNGMDYWRVLYFEPRKGGKLLVKKQLLKKAFGKRIFIIEVDYLLLPFVVKFERKMGSKYKKNYERMHYGYDRMVVKPGADK